MNGSTRTGKMDSQDKSPTSLRVRVRDILALFDTKPPGSATHVSSIVGILGEDLGASLFCEHLVRTRLGVGKVFGKAPTPGTRKGKRLDRWIQVSWADGKETLFQAEIKNWSAQAIGGKTLALEPSEEDYRAFRLNRWQNQWDHERSCFRHENVAKVLSAMRRPDGVDPTMQIEALVIYWYSIHPTGEAEVLFHHPTPDGSGFDRVWLFSMSSFLRSIPDDVLDLEMPNAVARIRWLASLVEQTPEGSVP